MIIGKKTFNPGHTHIMAILNVTPDSFSDGGKYNDVDKAMMRIEEMISEGADIIDIGGESTRPGYLRISDQEEIERIAPVIEKALKLYDIPLSVDTYKPGVAREALKLGADLINDIWGLKGDDGQQMASVISEFKVPCCLMHNRLMTEKNLKNRMTESRTNVHVADPNDGECGKPDTKIAEQVIVELTGSLEIAYKAGIAKDKIMLDPGVGFGKTYEENLGVIKFIKTITEAFEQPMLLATSRKSVIGLTLGTEKDERLEGTLATTAKAVEAGCMFVRVHDVKENARFIKMYEALM